MSAKLKSITPQKANGERVYWFKVEIEVGGKSQSFSIRDASKILDFNQLRAAVADHTGFLFTDDEEDWKGVLARVWRAPKEQPEPKEDDGSRLTAKEIEETPAELRAYREIDYREGRNDPDY